MTWPTGITAITLFVEELDTAKSFYTDVFGLPIHFEDSESVVFMFEQTMINLLKATAANELIDPASVGNRDAGQRFQITVGVDNVDAICAELSGRGIKLLNGPVDRPWGVRTASFQDPAGHIWEIAH